MFHWLMNVNSRRREINKWWLPKGENSKVVVPFHKKHDFWRERGWRGLEFERIEVGWDPIRSSKASLALAFRLSINLKKWQKQIYIHENIFPSTTQIPVRFFFFCVVNREAYDRRMEQKTNKEMGARDVFTVIRCQRHDCSVYTTCECAFPQRRRNYANDSIFANKLENFLENPRDEGIIIKESCHWKDSRYAPGNCDLRAGIFHHHIEDVTMLYS